MVEQGPHTSKEGSSDNSEYRTAFYEHSLLLLTCGHQRLLSEGQNFSNSEEPDITGELVRCTNDIIDESEPFSTFVVYEESPENTGGRKGKSRKRVDVVCRLTQRRPHLRLKFEAKRLKSSSHPVRIYLGDEGLGEFISGSYAPETDVAGMLGYIQSNNCDYWKDQLSTMLQKSEIQLDESGFNKIQNSYRSVHDRLVIGDKILVYHLLFEFL